MESKVLMDGHTIEVVMIDNRQGREVRISTPSLNVALVDDVVYVTDKCCGESVRLYPGRDNLTVMGNCVLKEKAW